MSLASLELSAFIIVGIGVLFGLGRIRFLQKKRSTLEAFSQKLLEAQEKERKRIAAELHGSLGQNLLIIKNRAELGLISPSDEPAMAEQLKEISSVCSEAIEQTRRTAHLHFWPHA